MTSPREIRTIILAPSYPPAFLGGGPPRSLEALVSYRPRNHSLRVIAPATDVDGSPLEVLPDQWQNYNTAEVIYVSGSFCFNAARIIRKHAHQTDILYVNSFFGWRHALLPLILSRLQRHRISNIVIAPRGELDEGALRLKPRRKALYLALVKQFVSSNEVTWHATSTREVAQIRRTFGGRAQVCLSENKTLNLAGEAGSTWQINPDQWRLAFLSRISPKKGLHILLGALKELPDNVMVDIFGPIEDVAYNKRCEYLAAAYSPTNVRFHGPIRPSEVVPTLGRFDAMVLPTAGENFGHAIAESLAAGCPVITTDTTPWSAALRAGAGVITDGRSEEAVAASVRYLFGLTEDERYAQREMACDAYREWVDARRPTDLYDAFEQLVSKRRHGQ